VQVCKGRNNTMQTYYSNSSSWPNIIDKALSETLHRARQGSTRILYEQRRKDHPDGTTLFRFRSELCQKLTA
jgi:IS5 family transposase